MLSRNKSLRIDGDGSQSRDFIHVDDIISANLFCMNFKGEFCGESYDVGNGKEISLNEIKNIVNEYQKRVSWDSRDARIGDIKNSVSNIENGLQKFGWSPKIDPISEFNNYFSYNFNL